MQLSSDMRMQLGSRQRIKPHQHPKPAAALTPVSSPAPTAQLSDVCWPLLEFYLNGTMCYPV